MVSGTCEKIQKPERRKSVSFFSVNFHLALSVVDSNKSFLSFFPFHLSFSFSSFHHPVILTFLRISPHSFNFSLHLTSFPISENPRFLIFSLSLSLPAIKEIYSALMPNNIFPTKVQETTAIKHLQIRRRGCPIPISGRSL